MQTIGDGLLAVGRHLLPFRQQGVLHVVALVRRHAFPGGLTIFQRHLLGGREAIVVFQILANLLLPLGRHALETFVVLQEAILLLRRHLAELLGPLPGQLGRTRVLNIVARRRCGGWTPHSVFVRRLPRPRIPCSAAGLVLRGTALRRRL